MLDKSFDPAAAEPPLYAAWEASGAFAADPGSAARPYTIMIPPPNVTGTLHVGHALTMTLQDTLIRWRRMQGRDVLWQPGTDHAGIATQMVVERRLAETGESRTAIGRAAFEDRVWAWKAESGGAITHQLRRLGASPDWARERFTMDPGLQHAVRTAFVALHEQGLIYRDRRLVNWDPKFRSAISDLEVESREIRGQIWYLRYPIDGEPERFVTVATTRPETLLADMAVAVHPDDPRHRDLVGRHAILPLVGRRIPIVADEHSDPQKGSGAVKITPAHDFNDFAVGRRHDLAMPSMLDEAGLVWLDEIEADLVGVPGVAEPGLVQALAGLPREAARAAVLAALEGFGLLERAEPHLLQAPHAQRGGALVEPRLTTQWFCDAATLAAPAAAAVESGRMRFAPKQWENTFFAWMRDIQPWCISRQLWWGHRIPAWYGPDGAVFVAHDEDGARAAARARYGKDAALTRDEDVLDTWFSSALWPFSTLGWPERTPELARYYPTDVLVTGFDIIFFWVARMTMMGLHFMGDVPFRTVCMHGLVRDERGRKMSKTLDNVIDPLILADRFGADALRFTVCALTGPGRDVKLGEAKVEGYRAFVTKLWNAARFCEMNAVAPAPDFAPERARSPLCRWLLAEANDAVAAADTALEAFRFNDYAAVCYRFTWNVFCDWFLEFAKPVFADADAALAVETRAAAAHVLGILLRLLHPAMPFVTETLWSGLGYGPHASLIRAAWPAPGAVAEPAAARAELDWVVRCVSEIRAVRAEMRVPPSVLCTVLLRDAAPETLARAARWAEPIRRMARATGIEPSSEPLPQGAVQVVLGEATLALPLAGLIDIDAERARLRRDAGKLEAEAEKMARKLDNPDFVANAPAAVIEKNRERLERMRTEIARLEAALRRLG